MSPYYSKQYLSKLRKLHFEVELKKIPCMKGYDNFTFRQKLNLSFLFRNMERYGFRKS